MNDKIPKYVFIKPNNYLYFSKLYPSSGWLSENRDRFSGRKPEPPGDKREFVITSLDTRKHNPHPKQIFHIKRIDNKKVFEQDKVFVNENVYVHLKLINQ